MMEVLPGERFRTLRLVAPTNQVNLNNLTARGAFVRAAIRRM